MYILAGKKLGNPSKNDGNTRYNSKFVFPEMVINTNDVEKGTENMMMRNIFIPNEGDKSEEEEGAVLYNF